MVFLTKIAKLKQSIVVCIGERFVVANVFYKGELIDTISINQDTIEPYTAFLQKYPKYTIHFLIGADLTILRNENLPIFQNLFLHNLVKKFVEQHYNKSDIVAYSAKSKMDGATEIYETVIASTTRTNYVESYVEAASNIFSLKFGGVYFLSLEIPYIIHDILVHTQNSEHLENLQILATITSMSGIQLFICHEGRIIEHKATECPSDKSDEYLYGMLEQEINDTKTRFSHLKLKVSAILLISRELQTISLAYKIDADLQLVIDYEALPSTLNITTTGFKNSDAAISAIFMQNKYHKAYNKQIALLNKMNTINYILSRPLLIGVAYALLLLAQTGIGLQTKTTKLQTLNSQYYGLMEQYRETHTQFSTVGNLNKLIDFNNAYKTIMSYKINPLDILHKIFDNPSLANNILKINISSIDSSKNDYKTEIDIISLPDAEQIFQNILPEYQITLKNNEGKDSTATLTVNMSHITIAPKWYK